MSSFSHMISRRAVEAAAERRAIFLRTALLKHPMVRAAFDLFPREMRKDVWLSGGTYGGEVSLGLSLRNLPGFKDKRLVRVLERFANSPIAWEAKTDDCTYGATPNRDYVFSTTVPLDNYFDTVRGAQAHIAALRAAQEGWRIPAEMTIKASVYAYVRTDSPTCRVVVTGVKEEVVRIETKEIVCD